MAEAEEGLALALVRQEPHRALPQPHRALRQPLAQLAQAARVEVADLATTSQAPLMVQFVQGQSMLQALGSQEALQEIA